MNISRSAVRTVPYVSAALLVFGSLLVDGPHHVLRRSGGCNGRVSSVGGVIVDASGAITRMEVDALARVRREREEALRQVSGDVKQTSAMRKVSLRQLEGALDSHLKSGTPIPDEMKLLAGLQNIQYVFVYPELQDIVLAGYGEGWKVTPRGDLVGASTGKPLLLLDDLLVALRYARQAAQGGISCSIDPTPEGIERLRRHVSGLATIGDPQQTGRGIEQALGPQTITVSGIPATTHFAHVLVAADYRMKRLGMNLDELEKSRVTFFRGRGCETCKGTGYKGRVGCYELMPVTDKVRELILAHASAYAIREAAIEAGMKTLKEDAMEKILLGMTTLEESLRVIYSG